MCSFLKLGLSTRFTEIVLAMSAVRAGVGANVASLLVFVFENVHSYPLPICQGNEKRSFPLSAWFLFLHIFSEALVVF